jgi:hypothetical protein
MQMAVGLFKQFNIPPQAAQLVAQAAMLITQAMQQQRAAQGGQGPQGAPQGAPGGMPPRA